MLATERPSLRSHGGRRLWRITVAAGVAAAGAAGKLQGAYNILTTDVRCMHVSRIYLGLWSAEPSRLVLLTCPSTTRAQGCRQDIASTIKSGRNL